VIGLEGEAEEKVTAFLQRRRFNPKQRDFFNERASAWDEMTVHDPLKVERIVSLLELKGDEAILDVGTGTGVMIPYYELRLTSGRVTAIDYSERMIERCRDKYPSKEHPKVSFRVLDLYQADYGPEFDVVVCYSCFPHFPDPQGAIMTFAGCLKEGGRLIVAHSSSKEHINTIHEEGGEEICTDFLPEIDIMREMMRRAGLETVTEQDDEEYYIAIAVKK
jgi:demethylmenaquinone methyltransferase/2-methoxy-6-polyprenyl-1,4-benzoquinol methylase